MTSKEKLEDFIDEVLNTSDDEIDIKECWSYKSLLKDLEVLEILKNNLLITGDSWSRYLLVRNQDIKRRELIKIEEWLDGE